MATGDRKDPFRGFNFRLEIDGVVGAAFHEASGLDVSSGATEQVVGTMHSPHKISGVYKVGDVTLKRGIVSDPNLWNWYNSVTQGKTEPKNGSIILTDETGEEKLRWNFVNGWPSKWSGPSLNAPANDVAIETLVITHEGLTKA